MKKGIKSIYLKMISVCAKKEDVLSSSVNASEPLLKGLGEVGAADNIKDTITRAEICFFGINLGER